MTHAFRAAALAAALSLCAASSAHAQFGGLRGLGRRAAGAAVNAVAGPPAGGAVSHTPGQPSFTASVIEMTGPVLDGLARSLAAEDSLRRAGADRASDAYASRYHACEARLAAADARYRELRDHAVNAQGEAAEKAYAELDAYRAPRCGHEPGLGEPEIRVLAGAAGGLTGRQYAVLKERAIPFCARGGATGNYVYSATEMDALKDRCPALKPALDALR